MPFRLIAARVSAMSAVPVFKSLGLTSFSGIVATEINPSLVREVAGVPADIGLIILCGLCVVFAFWSADRNRKTADKQADGPSALATQIQIPARKIQKVVYVMHGHRSEDVEEVGHVE